MDTDGSIGAIEVVVREADPVIPTPPKKPSTKSMPKWEADVRDRLKAHVKRFQKPLADMKQRSANEGDTRLLVTDILCYALGYDKFEDLTTEYQVRGEFADYGVKIDNDLLAFIEVKRIGTKMGVKQLRQVEMYAVNEGVEWVVLTDAVEWQVYHLTGGLPIIIDAVFSINLLEGGAAAVDQLYYLSRESLKRRQIDDLWKARRATSPESLGRVLSSDLVLNVVKKELKRITGHTVEVDELDRLMRQTVIRPECFESK